MDREVVDLYLDDIIPNRFQPREVFNEQALRELADSIRAHFQLPFFLYSLNVRFLLLKL